MGAGTSGHGVRLNILAFICLMDSEKLALVRLTHRFFTLSVPPQGGRPPKTVKGWNRQCTHSTV